jgi:hypothetical protein
MDVCRGHQCVLRWGRRRSVLGWGKRRRHRAQLKRAHATPDRGTERSGTAARIWLGTIAGAPGQSTERRRAHASDPTRDDAVDPIHGRRRPLNRQRGDACHG